jgi:putative two-component system response regulator
LNQDAILIVDDNQALREALQEMLNLAGFVVLSATNGQEALEHMNYVTPNLIISDITMPEMDGYDFFDAVRARSEWLSIPFIFLTARGGKKDILNGKGLGAEDYLVKPIHRDELLTAVRSRLNRSNQLRMARLREAYESTLTMLANAIEVRDPYTRGHVERVRDYALMLAQEMGLKQPLLDSLRFGSILHDIGKIHISDVVLRKPQALDCHEWESIKQHPTIGAEMVRDIPYLQPAIPVILYHHEFWDGSGYPDQLVGDDIPIVARIVVVADAFDAMTTDRAYQPAKTLEAALQEIIDYSGEKYDPAIVTTLQKCWDSGQVAEIAAR